MRSAIITPTFITTPNTMFDLQKSRIITKEMIEPDTARTLHQERWANRVTPEARKMIKTMIDSTMPRVWIALAFRLRFPSNQGFSDALVSQPVGRVIWAIP
jgi:hypothetical protein